MDFAVVKINGKQHLVNEGSIIEVNATLGEVGAKIAINEVLLTSIDGNVVVGTPLVEKAVVNTEVATVGKGEKIRVSKFKAKSRYRKTIGFRPLLTTLKVLNLGNEKVSTDSGKQPVVSKGRAKKSTKSV